MTSRFVPVYPADVISFYFREENMHKYITETQINFEWGLK